MRSESNASSSSITHFVATLAQRWASLRSHLHAACDQASHRRAAGGLSQCGRPPPQFGGGKAPTLTRPRWRRESSGLRVVAGRAVPCGRPKARAPSAPRGHTGSCAQRCGAWVGARAMMRERAMTSMTPDLISHQAGTACEPPRAVVATPMNAASVTETSAGDNAEVPRQFGLSGVAP